VAGERHGAIEPLLLAEFLRGGGFRAVLAWRLSRDPAALLLGELRLALGVQDAREDLTRLSFSAEGALQPRLGSLPAGALTPRGLTGDHLIDGRLGFGELL